MKAEVGEFARRWWRVGLPIVVLAITIPVALVLSGDGDGEGQAPAPSLDPSPPVASAPPPTETGARDESQGSRKPKEVSREPNQAPSGSSEEQADAGPESPYGPPGKPVGDVPPGAEPSADATAVALTLRTFLRAISRADGNQACAQLSPEGRERVERELAEAAPETRGSPCEGSIVLYQGGYGKSARDPQITDVRVAGERATAIGPPGRRKGELGKYENVWLIDNYGWGE